MALTHHPGGVLAAFCTCLFHCPVASHRALRVVKRPAVFKVERDAVLGPSIWYVRYSRKGYFCPSLQSQPKAKFAVTGTMWCLSHMISVFLLWFGEYTYVFLWQSHEGIHGSLAVANKIHHGSHLDCTAARGKRMLFSALLT